MQQFDVVKGKSATDMRMTIDAMDLLYRGNVDGFGIMSSDSDFLPLAQRIREDGLPVYGFGTAKTPVSFQQACTRFFDVGALAMDEDESSSSPKANAGQRPVDTELLQVLGSAYKASKRDEEGYTPLSELGQRAKAVSSFAARNFGYTRLSDLIKAVPEFRSEERRGRHGCWSSACASGRCGSFIHRNFARRPSRRTVVWPTQGCNFLPKGERARAQPVVAPT